MMPAIILGILECHSAPWELLVGCLRLGKTLSAYDSQGVVSPVPDANLEFVRLSPCINIIGVSIEL